MSAANGKLGGEERVSMVSDSVSSHWFSKEATSELASVEPVVDGYLATPPHKSPESARNGENLSLRSLWAQNVLVASRVACNHSLPRDKPGGGVNSATIRSRGTSPGVA